MCLFGERKSYRKDYPVSLGNHPTPIPPILFRGLPHLLCLSILHLLNPSCWLFDVVPVVFEYFCCCSASNKQLCAGGSVERNLALNTHDSGFWWLALQEFCKNRVEACWPEVSGEADTAQLPPELWWSSAFTDKHLRGLLFKSYSPSIYLSEYFKNAIVPKVEDLWCI